MGLVNVASIITHSPTGYVLFFAGMLMGTMIHPTFGILTIFGGLFVGFDADVLNNRNEQRKHTKALFYGSYMFLFVSMSSTYLVMIHLLFD